ncbi:Uncharacterised protein [Clostridioides difficile]|nr:Uncharacterised protein [Clostridioides difficile]
MKKTDSKKIFEEIQKEREKLVRCKNMNLKLLVLENVNV